VGDRAHLHQHLAGGTAAFAGGLHGALGFAALRARPLGPALGSLAARLGYALDELAEVPLTNSRGERVGTIAAR
jgi:hypothetical protein